MFKNFTVIFVILCLNLFGTSAWDFYRLRSDDTAELADAPFLAAIMVLRKFHCNGVIISSQFILTTAACILSQRNRIKDIRIRVGTTDLSKGGETYTVQTYFVHNITTREIEETMLYTLEDRIDFGYKQRPIRIGRLPREIFHSDPWQVALPFLGHYDGKIVGWGKDRRGDGKQFTLRKVTDTVIERIPRCKRFMNQAGLTFYNHTLCAFVEYAFFGSDGSVLVYDKTLIGLASYFDVQVLTSTNREAYASVFTYVHQVRKFLRNVIDDIYTNI
ncbi:trypsin-like isoform X2 [Prorops nasuta]|uniref:trypsin-like isoform X2 n=1 Tax=Prorops nasuta TaxID=863751 RepID=UPI0034CDB757